MKSLFSWDVCVSACSYPKRNIPKLLLRGAFLLRLTLLLVLYLQPIAADATPTKDITVRVGSTFTVNPWDDFINAFFTGEVVNHSCVLTNTYSYNSSELTVTEFQRYPTLYQIGSGEILDGYYCTYNVKALKAGKHTLTFVLRCNYWDTDSIYQNYHDNEATYYMTYNVSVTKPVAVLSTNSDSITKTLTLTYGVPDENLHDGEDGTYELNTGENSYEEPKWFVSNRYVTKVVFTDEFKDARPTTTQYWFTLMSNLESIEGLANLNTSNVKNMRNMFSQCSKLTKLDVSKFDTRNVTNMMGMFSGCSGLTYLDLGSFNTASVIAMGSMFDGCSNLTSLNLSSFNTLGVTNMGRMFYGCSSLTNLDVSSFDTSNVTDMGWMFYNCSSLKSLDVSKFDTKNVTFAYSIFGNCSSLTTLDVSHFDTGKIAYMIYMFGGCSSLISLDVSKFDTKNATNMSRMFYDCSSLKNLDVSHFDTNYVTDMSSMFEGCSSLTNLDVSNFDTKNVTGMGSMFNDCSNLTSLDVSNFDTKNVTFMGDMFSSCSSLTSLDISNYDTKNVTYISSMLYHCCNLRILDVGCNDFTTATIYDNAFCNLGTLASPCTLVVTKDFDKTVLGGKVNNYYEWLGGYFSDPIIGETVVIDSAGYASYSPKGDIDLTKQKGVRAFKARYDDYAQTIVIAEITDAPANTPLIFVGDSGKQIVAAADATPDAITDNELQVSDEDIVADGTQWIFAERKNGGSLAKSEKMFVSQVKRAGFEKVDEGTTIKAGKVCLTIDVGSTDKDFIAFGDIVTGIRQVSNQKESVGTDNIYNLSGQRVGKGYKGIAVKNGRKVMME